MTAPATRPNLGVFAGGLTWPAHAAEAENVFRDDDLHVEVHSVAGSVQQMPGLLDGTYDVVVTPFDDVVGP